jgi:hypothetical protein
VPLHNRHEMEGNGEVNMLKSDHISSTNVRTRKLTGWCSSKALHMYSGGSRLEA